MSEGPLYGKWPGEVDSYDAPSRTCRVRIPGITDGSSVLPQAVFEYPIGDRSDHADSKSHTEIRVLANDAVWLEFECGDPRFPIITGFRDKRQGNPTGWRRWRHANIEMTADNELIINATKVTWNVSGDVIEHIGGSQTTDIGGKQKTDVSGAMESTAATSKHSAATHQLTAQTSIAGSISTSAGPGGSGASLQGPVSFAGGSLTHNGKNVGATHTHNEHNVNGGPTDPPN